MRNLPVQSLNFDDIKKNLKEFLKGNPRYKDFNFEASGINVLLNTLAYQTHYIGYFVKMLLDEAFVDSAHSRQALLSHAKRTGYIPKNRKAASAEVVLTVNTTLAQEPASRSISLDRGETFRSANSQADARVFSVLDGTSITSRIVNGSDVQYISEPLTIYEGILKTWNFLADGDVVNQRFIIRDPNVDIDTIRVRVRENALATNSVEFKRADDIADLDPTSNVFFVSTDENGFYQIFFGNDVFGVQPSNGNAIEVTYISTNGESGNGARTFTFNQPGGWPWSNFSVQTNSPSDGGREPETVEELRFAIPNHYRRQGRLVTEPDFRSVLLEEFRNIDSINVWGGEKHHIRDYGKIYVSIKPKNTDRLTPLAREQIRSLITKKGLVGIDVVFVDPEFIDVILTVNAKLDLRKTNRSQPEMINLIRDRVAAYNSETLSKFDSNLSDVNLLSSIKEGEPAFTTLYSRKELSKLQLHIHGSSASHIVNFGNALVPGSIKSSDIIYGPSTTIIQDDGKGNLNLINKVTKNVIIGAGTVDYNTGQITYSLPTYARAIGFDLSAAGEIRFNAVPVYPDVNTYLNNIVRITETKINAS